MNTKLGHIATVFHCVLLTSSQSVITPQLTDFVWGVDLQLSIGKTVSLEWTPDVREYSVAVPYDAPLVALRVPIASPEESEKETILQTQSLTMRVPQKNLVFALAPGVPSQWVEISTNMSTELTVEIGAKIYRIRTIRALIASNGRGQYPDPALQIPPLGTLSGLVLQDSFGAKARMAWFTPRQSFYYASIGYEARDVRVVATPNDPEATLSWRRDGGKWDNLVSGLTSPPAEVSSFGWTLIEVRVQSATAEALGLITKPLVYQIAVTKDVVCHPKCRVCNGPLENDCLACFAPLILYEGRCLYTACQENGTYFDLQKVQCSTCNSSCQECQDAGSSSCTVCPPFRFLLTASELDVVGECVATCPFGFYVQPANRQCQRVPPNLPLDHFYIRLTLRTTVEEFTEQQDLWKQVLTVSAEVLAVSPTDVKFHRWDVSRQSIGIQYYIEVNNPFLTRNDIKERIPIDAWFAAMPVPIDGVLTLSERQLYKPPPGNLPEPLLQPWGWVILGAAAGIVFILFPMYHFYFIRKYFEKTRYKPKQDNKEAFIEEILNRAPEAEIKKIAHSTDRTPQ